jgi:hypothetical protein
LLNPQWINEHAATPEKLVMLTLHELHHVMLGHTRLYPRATPLDNLVFDAVINAMLCHLLPDRACVAMMTDFYREDRFPECLLRPSRGWKPGQPGVVPQPLYSAKLMHLQSLYAQLYTPQGVGYDELRDALQRTVTPEILQGVTLLGDHRDETDGASSAGQLEIRSPALLGEVRRIVERWPQPTDPIRGRSLANELKRMAVKIVPPSNATRLARLLQRVGAHSQHGCLQGIRSIPHLAETPLPTMDRRSAVMRSLGAQPLLHRTTVPTRRMAPSSDRVHVYLDVSGSVTGMVPALYGAVLACGPRVHPVVHLFSTKVFDVTLQQLRAGRCETTNGTCIECVGEHMTRHGVRRAVLVTDGFVGKPGASTHAAMKQAVVGVALTPGSTQRADLEEVADHWANLS